MASPVFPGTKQWKDSIFPLPKYTGWWFPHLMVNMWLIYCEWLMMMVMIIVNDG